MEPAPAFVTLLRTPDLVRAFGPDGEIKLQKTRDGIWEGGGVEVHVVVQSERVQLSLRGEGVKSIQFRWRGDLRSVKRFLGDHWERSYADLEWRGGAPNRVMPWYFMAHKGDRTHGYGVRTHPRALCFWMADAEGISLFTDVRSGGEPVKLGGRTLEIADVVCREGKAHESAFRATQEFCRQMCPTPRLPSKPVYGTNDWNYAYGKSSADLIERVSGLISELSPDKDNRPFSVIDEGWADGPYRDHYGYGPWLGNPNFGDMGKFADRLKKIGVRPGIWFRPLTPLPEHSESLRTPRGNHSYLDPTLPEVKEHVASHIKRFVDWGYEMIKHDFSTVDILGRWGMQMGSEITNDGWHMHDQSKTNAEIIMDLYQTIRDAAGSAYLIGCNTMTHLAATYHEVQRTGDDTSGRSWNRNRRMGVNTLGFRAAHHRTLYEVDPDIVSITQQIPWPLVEQWLHLVSQSGTALFVAIDPGIVEEKHRVALRQALANAARTQDVGEPLDWMDTDCPRVWNLMGKRTEFNWMGDFGADPYGD